MECSRPNAVERERLEKALGLLAALVARDTAFLPFFQKIEVELNLSNANAAALDRARLMARSLASGLGPDPCADFGATMVPRSHGPIHSRSRRILTG